MWQVEREPYFNDCVEAEGISLEVVNHIEDWAKTSCLTPTKKSRCVYRNTNNIFQIWNAKLPDPDFNRGSRGGFRLVCYYLISQRVIKLVFIERRNDLGSKTERPKDQDKYSKFIDQLARELNEKYGIR